MADSLGTIQAAPTAKGAAMRERILAAAAKVFAKRGYERTRVADITKAAKTSHGNFYRHFNNKDDALLAALEPPLAELQNSFKLPSHSPLLIDEHELARHLIESFRVYARHRKLLRLMREAAARGEEASFFSLWMNTRSRFIEGNAVWLTRFKKEGLLPPEFDPDLAAEMLLALAEQVAYVKLGLAVSLPSDEEIERLGRHCAMIWYRGVFAGASPAMSEASLKLVHGRG
jgi:AcrR family transcriptional regulator